MINKYKKALLIYFIITTCTVFAEIKISSTSTTNFSPNGDGIKDNALINIYSDITKLKSYELEIINSMNDSIKTIKDKVEKAGNELVIEWNGKDRLNFLQKEGQYKLNMIILDENGESHTLNSLVTIDLTRPVASIQNPVNRLLSPNYDGISDYLKIKQSGSREALWIGEFINKKNETVRTIIWKNSKPRDFKWKGLSDYKRKVLDGEYLYRLYCEDSAGNKSEYYEIDNIVVDGSTPKVNISTDTSYFSPNGDGIKDFVNINIDIEAKDKVKDIEFLLINDDSKNEVHYPIKKMESHFILYGSKPDGTYLENGFYTLLLSITYNNGYKSMDTARINLFRTEPKMSFIINKKLFYKEENKYCGSFEFATELLSSNIINNWELKIANLDEDLLIVKKGENKPPSNILLTSDEFKDEQYYISFIVNDKNGNIYSYKHSLAPEFDLTKRGDKIFYDIEPIFFKPYETKTIIDNDTLDNYLKIFKKYPDNKIIIESHAYDDGSDIDRLNTLSYERGAFIKSILVENGIKEEKILIRSLGVKDNNAPDNPVNARRVEFLIY